MININPKIWGQAGWIFLHSITFSYPVNPDENDRNRMKNFFLNVQYILPCERCQNNYHRHLQELPLNDFVLSTRKNLIEWLINIRNKSNNELGKPNLTLKDVIFQLESGSLSSEKKEALIKFDTSKLVIILLIVIVILLIIYYKYLKN